jgi:hypothetical protein
MGNQTVIEVRNETVHELLLAKLQKPVENRYEVTENKGCILYGSSIYTTC